MGERVAQDRLRSPLPAAYFERTKADVRAVCQRTCRKRTVGEEKQAEGEEGSVSTAA